MKTATEITANAIYKVTVKETGSECYAVPSDSNPGAYYVTCFEHEAANWTCTCAHGQYQAQRGQGAHCKHTRAAQVSVVANKNAERERKEAEREAKQFLQIDPVVLENERHLAETHDAELFASDPFLGAEAEQKRIEREQWNEFQFQCGAYDHYWN